MQSRRRQYLLWKFIPPLILLLVGYALYAPSWAEINSASANNLIIPTSSSLLSSDLASLIAQAHSSYFPFVLRAPSPLGSLADGWYLMLDDEHIASRTVPRIYHPFQKYPNNPIMVADRPWEGNVIQLYGTVLPGFRMWYSCSNVNAGKFKQVLYAESQDGINWQKPDLFGTGTNAIFGGQQADMVSVLHTPQEIEKAYKLMTYQNLAFHGYWSLDGLLVNPYPNNPLFYNGYDVAHFYWDSGRQQYGGTAREYAYVNGVLRRTVRLINSSDFTTWTNLPYTLAPDLTDDQLNPGYYPHFYGLPVFRMGEQYVGLLWFFKARDQTGFYGPVNTQIVSSHDGINWIRQESPRPPLLDIGPPGTWDAGQVYTASAPIRVGDEFWLYYSGCNLEHGASLTYTVCSIGLAKVGCHRLASLRGSGSVLTQNMTPNASTLRVNYEATQGTIRVELQRDGLPIPGYEAGNCTPLVGDAIDQPVSWSGKNTLPAGPFQVKFFLENSALYAFTFR